MYKIYAKSSIGYNHIKNKKPCQDFSSFYQDPQRMVITCCDGHGGDMYIRSKLGSLFASKAIMKTFSELSPYLLRQYDDKEIEDKIKLQILCDWNRQVEESISFDPIHKYELEGLDEDQILSLRINPAKAYGTTLSGALLVGNKLVVASIGDTECLLIKKGQIEKIFDDSDEPVGNVTYSMCQEDAYKHLRVKVVDFSDYDGIMLCTDGLSAPYQSYVNLNESFVKPLYRQLNTVGNIDYIDDFIDVLAKEKGVGDDVSLAFIIKSHSHVRDYK